MAPLASAALLLLAAAATVRAHFTLDYPPTIGFSDDDEPTAPCGSFTPDFTKDTVTDFHVGGDNIALNLLHPQGTWLYRATLDQTAAGNWTQVFPNVLQTGLGKFCEPAVGVPASWAGQKGVLGVVVDGPDGILYQCAAVNFVSGSASSNQGACTNSSGVTASFTTDANLTPLASGNGTASNSTGGGGSSTTGGGSSTTTTGSGSAATTSKNAGAGPVGGSVPLGGAVAVTLAAMLGAAIMLL